MRFCIDEGPPRTIGQSIRSCFGALVQAGQTGTEASNAVFEDFAVFLRSGCSASCTWSFAPGSEEPVSFEVVVGLMSLAGTFFFAARASFVMSSVSESTGSSIEDENYDIFWLYDAYHEYLPSRLDSPWWNRAFQRLLNGTIISRHRTIYPKLFTWCTFRVNSIHGRGFFGVFRQTYAR